MGSDKGEEIGACRESRRISKPHLIFFFLSFLISIAGGSVLGWWLYKYHPTNRQLWMVPFGVVLFFTPVIVWFSLIISDLSISKSDEEEAFKANQHTHPVDNSFCEPKKLSLA